MACRPSSSLAMLLVLPWLFLAPTAGSPALPRKLAAAAPSQSAPGNSSSSSRNSSSAPSNSSSSRPTNLVKAAWSISDLQRHGNGSAASVWYPNETVMTELHEQMAERWTLTPGQIRLVALAKVAVGYHFSGVAGWNDLTSAALEQAASDMAGGYDPLNITAEAQRPELGVPADLFASSAAPPVKVKDAHTGDPISDGGAGPPAPPGRRRRRHLLQQQQQQQQQQGDDSSSSGEAGEAALAAGEGDVYVTYSKVDPRQVAQLLSQLQASCGGVPLSPGSDLTATPCGTITRQHLEASGLTPQADYSQVVAMAPLVSLDIQLTVSFNEQQAATGIDRQIAAWLSQPGNVEAALRSAGSQYVMPSGMTMQWLQTPEVLVINVQPQQQQAASVATPAFVTGVAIGGAVAVVTAIVAILLLRRRYKRQIKAAKSEASNSSTNTNNGQQRRRRRREGKRRYLLPDPPAPSSLGPSASGAAAGAGAAGDDDDDDGDAAAGSAEAADADDANMLLRPRLRELGDSVTSAVRFEQDDEEEGEEGLGPAASDTAADTANAAAGTGRQRQRQQSLQQQHSASCFSVPEEAAGSSVTSSNAAAAGAAGVAAAAVAGSAAATAGAAAAAGQVSARADTCQQLDCSPTSSGAGPPWQQHQQHQQRPQEQEQPQEDLASSSSHPAAGGKASPFCKYNFSELLEQQWPPLAAASSSDAGEHKGQRSISPAAAAAAVPEKALLPLSSSLLQGSARIAVSPNGGCRSLSPWNQQQQLSGLPSSTCQRLSSSIALSSGWDSRGMPPADNDTSNANSYTNSNANSSTSSGWDSSVHAAMSPAQLLHDAAKPDDEAAVASSVATAGFTTLQDLA